MALKHLTKKVVSQNYSLSAPVERAIFKQFQRVTKDAKLGLVSRILETDEFVAVVDDTNRCVSIVTHLDLLSFAAKDTKATNGATKGISNSVDKGVREVVSNDTTNGNHSTNGHSNGH